MPVLSEEALKIQSETDIVNVRKVVRAKAIDLRFTLVEQTKIVTAASELARNTLIYGGGGQLSLQLIQEEGRQGIKLCFEDKGPGIADIETAMKDGFSSGAGMGLGLPGARRLANEFSISSKLGEGTKVIIIKWRGH